MTWLSGWHYRKSITLSRASGAVSNHQMRLLIGESSGTTGEDVDCGGLCLSTFNDLRFTASDGTTLLDFWIESITGTTPNQLATVWIKFNSIGTSATTFYMYYGKTGANSYSSGIDTFIFFDANEHPGYPATKLADTQGSPEGLALINGYFYQAEQKNPTRIHEIDPSNGSATGEYFDFAGGVATHSSALVWYGSYLWVADYDAYKVFKVDLDASLASHSASIIGSFIVGDGAGFTNKPSALSFVRYNGGTQLMITEWATQGSIIIVDYVEALNDGTVDGNVLRTFKWTSDGNLPGRIQGIYRDSADTDNLLLINCQKFTAGGRSVYPSAYMRYYEYGDLHDIAADSDLSTSRYWADFRYYISTTRCNQQPAIYDGDIYIADEYGEDLISFAEGQEAGYYRDNWTQVTGSSLFSLSDAHAYEVDGEYSALMPASTMVTLSTNQGACVLEAELYPTTISDRCYFGAGKASDNSDRLVIGVYTSIANWRYWDGAWTTTSVAVNLNTWNSIKYIADGAGNIKLYVNGTKVYDGSRFDEINQIIYQCPSGYGGSMYIDTVRVRKYLGTEPAWGSWGSEEENPTYYDETTETVTFADVMEGQSDTIIESIEENITLTDSFDGYGPWLSEIPEDTVTLSDTFDVDILKESANEDIAFADAMDAYVYVLDDGLSEAITFADLVGRQFEVERGILEGIIFADLMEGYSLVDGIEETIVVNSGLYGEPQNPIRRQALFFNIQDDHIQIKYQHNQADRSAHIEDVSLFCNRIRRQDSIRFAHLGQHISIKYGHNVVDETTHIKMLALQVNRVNNPSAAPRDIQSVRFTCQGNHLSLKFQHNVSGETIMLKQQAMHANRINNP